jgi:transposase-like protein
MEVAKEVTAKCPKCKKPTTEKDYYFRRVTGEQVSPNCKDCVKKATASRKSTRQAVDADFLSQYFT